MPGAAGRLCHGYGVCTSRGTVPYRTVPYRTTPCLTLQQEHTAKHILPCLSQRKPGGKKAAVGNRRKCGKLCGKRVENSFQGAQAGAGGRGAAGSLMGTFGRAWSGGGAAVDRGGARGRGCGGADAGSGGGRARRSMGQCRQGDVRVRCWLAAGCGLARAFGRVRSGGCFRPVRVWWTLLAGALWRPCGAGRGCSAGRAGWLSYREKNA